MQLDMTGYYTCGSQVSSIVRVTMDRTELEGVKECETIKERRKEGLLLLWDSSTRSSRFPETRYLGEWIFLRTAYHRLLQL